MNVGAAAGRAGGWHGGIVIIRGFWTIVLAGGGRIEVAICNQADELDHTTRLPTSTTQQSTTIEALHFFVEFMMCTLASSDSSF